MVTDEFVCNWIEKISKMDVSSPEVIKTQLDQIDIEIGDDSIQLAAFCLSFGIINALVKDSLVPRKIIIGKHNVFTRFFDDRYSVKIFQCYEISNSIKFQSEVERMFQ